jgi:hypothetical protein
MRSPSSRLDGRRRRPGQLDSVGVLADGRVVVLLGGSAESTSWEDTRAALDAATAAVVA